VTGEHVLFIPGVLMVGMFLGFIFGMRAARNQMELAQRRATEREAAREARKAKSAMAKTKPEDDP
jgi:DNA invertase Pin-like site-specific DNA recombinase